MRHDAAGQPDAATATGTLPAPLVAALQGLGDGADASFFTTALAAFAALIHRHTGQDEIPVGVRVAGDLVVVTADLAGEPGFRGLLVRVKDAVERACAGK